jgi:hypothetical protein
MRIIHGDGTVVSDKVLSVRVRPDGSTLVQAEGWGGSELIGAELYLLKSDGQRQRLYFERAVAEPAPGFIYGRMVTSD